MSNPPSSTTASRPFQAVSQVNRLVIVWMAVGLFLPYCAKAQTTSDSSQSERYKLYVDALLERYDTDRDKQLNADELQKMRNPWHSADTNSDGVVTRTELVDAVQKQGVGRPTQRSARMAPPRRVRTVEADSNSVATSRLMIIVFAANRPFEMANELQGAPAQKIVEAIAKFKASESVEFCESLTCNVTDQNKTLITSGGTKPQRTAKTMGRSGQVAYRYEQMQTGLDLSLLPKFRGDVAELQMDINKSFVVESEVDETDEFPPPSIRTIRFNSTILCERNRAQVATMSQANLHWGVIVVNQPEVGESGNLTN